MYICFKANTYHFSWNFAQLFWKTDISIEAEVSRHCSVLLFYVYGTNQVSRLDELIISF